MSDINKVIITGRVTRDTELRYTPGGTAVSDVSLVSNRIWTKNGERQEDSTFVDITLWGKQAETLAEMLTKGRHIMVEGRLKLNSWETQEGVKRNKLVITAENINLTPAIGMIFISAQFIKFLENVLQKFPNYNEKVKK